MPEEGLEAGDVGTVVAVYADGNAYKIEFTTLEGKTAAVATVEASNICPVGPLLWGLCWSYAQFEQGSPSECCNGSMKQAGIGEF